MRITSLKVKNYGPFRDLQLRNLPNLAVFVGPNGVGKSTLFDVFAFLHDALQHNVRIALNQRRRGGFDTLRTRDSDGPIMIELQFRMEITGKSRLVTYHIEVNRDNDGVFVAREFLRYKRGEFGAPYHYLDFRLGEGHAVTNEEDFDEPSQELQREEQRLRSRDILAIKGLGQFERFLAASAFRDLIENWHVSDFHITEARPSPESGYAEHLSERGENLALVTQYLESQHPETFGSALRRMEKAVPGVSNVKAEETIDGRVALLFYDSQFERPFIADRVSDGTIKMWAYLLLLHDPTPHPLLCIEEPENQLYHTLMERLLEELRTYATRGDGQVIVTTHSTDILDAAEPREVYWLIKQDGCTTVRRASDDPQIVEEHEMGSKLGWMWKTRAFEGAYPD